MHSTTPAPSKLEIMARVDPERRQQFASLQERFAQPPVPATREIETTLVYSGSPDFIFHRNSDDTLSARRIWLPSRHILLNEPVTALETPQIVYGRISDNSEDREVRVYQSTIPEKDLIFGVFGRRVV